jgi:hypothetical protein
MYFICCYCGSLQLTPKCVNCGASKAKAIRPPVDQWQVRYRNREGKWCQVKATTKQLTERIATGNIPPNVKLCPLGESVFRSVYWYTEFLALVVGQ